MKRTFAAAAALLALSGCASIFNGSTQSIVISSVPEGATASVTNRAGMKVHTGTTPVTLTLNRGAGYFKPEIYKVELAMEGYAPQELTVTGTVSGWYIGNVLFGGLIGMLAVDPVTGAMYVFPDSVSASLQPQGGATTGAASSLTIVSTESLTPEQLKQARAIEPTATPR